MGQLAQRGTAPVQDVDSQFVYNRYVRSDLTSSLVLCNLADVFTYILVKDDW